MVRLRIEPLHFGSDARYSSDQQVRFSNYNLFGAEDTKKSMLLKHNLLSDVSKPSLYIYLFNIMVDIGAL